MSEETKNTNDETTKERIEDRRKLVYSLHLQGLLNSEIATLMKVSLSTVEKDLHEIRTNIQLWFSDFESDGIRNAYRDSFELLDIIKGKLLRACRDEMDTTMKIKVLDSLADKILKKLFILKDRHEILQGRYHNY